MNNSVHHKQGARAPRTERTNMLVKVAPMGEQVVEVNVESGSTVDQILNVAEVDENGRSITVNNTPADLTTTVTAENAVISLANKSKGGC